MAEPIYGSVRLDLLQGGFTAQEVLTALGSVAAPPQFLEAARRFGKTGLIPADVIERVVPSAS